MRVGPLLVLVLAACGETTPKRELDLDLIHVSNNARMTSDSVGEGKFVEQATFVLVDAENTAGEGAYVTLGGELVGTGGAVVGKLIAQSIWVPAHESRTFALVDTERKERPDAKTARIKVRGALVSAAPTAHIEELHSFDSHDQLIVQAYLVNEANRTGTVVVVASFHDATDHPITRPFQVVKIGAKDDGTPGACPDAASSWLPVVSRCTIQFIGPPGAKRGTMFVSDISY